MSDIEQGAGEVEEGDGGKEEGDEGGGRPTTSAQIAVASSSCLNQGASGDGTRGKKRKRRRTRNLRAELRLEIETAIANKESAIYSSTLLSGNSSSDAREREGVALLLADVLDVLGLTSLAGRLSKPALASIAGDSKLFAISRDARELRVLPEREADLCTVYLDNVPRSLDADRIRSRAGDFGRVMAVKTPRRAKSRERNANAKWKNDGFAFVRFVNDDAATAFCRAYAGNLPSSSHLTDIASTSARACEQASLARTPTTRIDESSARGNAKEIAITDREEEENGPSRAKRRRLADKQRTPSSLDTEMVPSASEEPAMPGADQREQEATSETTAARKSRHACRRRSKKALRRNRDLFAKRAGKRQVRELFAGVQAMSVTAYKHARQEYIEERKKNLGQLKRALTANGAPLIQGHQRGRYKLIARLNAFRDAKFDLPDASPAAAGNDSNTKTDANREDDVLPVIDRNTVQEEIVMTTPKRPSRIASRSPIKLRNRIQQTNGVAVVSEKGTS